MKVQGSINKRKTIEKTPGEATKIGILHIIGLPLDKKNRSCKESWRQGYSLMVREGAQNTEFIPHSLNFLCDLGERSAENRCKFAGSSSVPEFSWGSAAQGQVGMPILGLPCGILSDVWGGSGRAVHVLFLVTSS